MGFKLFLENEDQSRAVSPKNRVPATPLVRAPSPTNNKLHDKVSSYAIAFIFTDVNGDVSKLFVGTNFFM